MNETEKANPYDRHAQNILNLSKNTLLISFRFLDLALSQFEYVPGQGTIATDGKHLFYDPRWVLEQYQKEPTVMTRDFFHIVLHCIFHHSFLNKDVVPELWSLACDAAVENAIDELESRWTWASRSVRQIPFLSELRHNLKSLTAEKIYLYLLDQEMSPMEADLIRRDFSADAHDIWFPVPEEALAAALQEEGSEENSESANGSKKPDEAAKDAWKEIAERMQTELETFSKQQGDQAGSIMQNLSAVNREAFSYKEFLRQFAVRGEALKANDDEFDYIFYTYGMKLYENMPLIEPLEYKEVKKIREFVIAIDTSGSVSGDLVQKFITKTYNILKQQENFFEKIVLHIIQCDAKIQEDRRISGPEEFEEYIEHMQLHGFGGTDFRPVFTYIDKLRREKELLNLNGLLYFTDGYGTFPETAPDYKTAFIFVDDEYNNPEVPVWAIRLILPDEEIREEEF